MLVVDADLRVEEVRPVLRVLRVRDVDLIRMLVLEFDAGLDEPVRNGPFASTFHDFEAQVPEAASALLRIPCVRLWLGVSAHWHAQDVLEQRPACGEFWR